MSGIAAERAKISDANHLLYLVKANQTFAAGPTGTLADLEKIKAKTLLLYAPEDQVFRAERCRATAAAIAKGGAPVETGEIHGPFGHGNGLFAIAPLGEKIKDYDGLGGIFARADEIIDKSIGDFATLFAVNNAHSQAVRGLAPHPPVSILTLRDKPLEFMSIFEPPKAASAGLFERD